jgi:protein-disulfide isomerase
LAARFGVRSTPTLFVNGVRLEGLRPLAELRGAVARELATARWLRASGMPVSQIYLRRTQQTLLGIGDEAPSRECVPLEGSPAQGPESALVTIVQFSDFECSFCKQSAPVLKALLPRFKDQLKMVWKSFPLPQHTYARPAAKFALEAREVGGDRAFWIVHEMLLAEKGELDDRKLTQIAQRAGLPEKPLLDAAHSGEHDAELLADVKLGRQLDVEGVPTFFVNGRRISGVASRRSFDGLVLEELASARKIAAASRETETIYRLLCRR